VKDSIFYGNLIGLLKRGKWNLSLDESAALIEIYQEAVRRNSPPKVEQVSSPIKGLTR
jgi:hypothetical protein